MENLIFQFGYLGLFVISFLAATLLPVGSEVAVVTMTLSGYEPLAVFTTATAGNILGSIVNYYVGKYGADFIFSRYIKVDEAKRKSLGARFQKWGAPLLLLAWVPVVGDPLTVVAGSLHMNFYVFTFWVTLSKALRYALLIFATGAFH